MLAYLMFDGPQDGTMFSGLHNPYAPEFEEPMAERMEGERERHQNTGRTSPYRNDDGSWNKPKLARVVAAGRHINDDELGFRFAGRWAGDDVALIGDYEESGVYQETKEEWVYEYEGERFTARATGAAPVVPESIERSDIQHATREGDPEPGDLCHVRHPDKDGERVYAEFVEVAENEWTDITPGLKRAFTHFVGEGWVADHEDSWLMRPDMIVGEDSNGETQVFTGSETVVAANDLDVTDATTDTPRTPTEIKTDGGEPTDENGQTSFDRFA